jgi:hypothetical protein
LPSANTELADKRPLSDSSLAAMMVSDWFTSSQAAIPMAPGHVLSPQSACGWHLGQSRWSVNAALAMPAGMVPAGWQATSGASLGVNSGTWATSTSGSWRGGRRTSSRKLAHSSGLRYHSPRLPWSTSTDAVWAESPAVVSDRDIRSELRADIEDRSRAGKEVRGQRTSRRMCVACRFRYSSLTGGAGSC